MHAAILGRAWISKAYSRPRAHVKRNKNYEADNELRKL